jgi:hypothetical protein
VIWNHLAAILFFGGPLFYCGLWMAIAPSRIASLLEPVLPTHAGALVRCAGIILVLVAMGL